MNKAQQGFTLTELLVTVSMIGILSAIAIPSYNYSVSKSRRTDAKTELANLANFMERQNTEFGCYTDPGADGICASGDDTTPVLPYNVAPRTGTAYYTIDLVQVTPFSFTLTATPIPGQAQEHDDCGALSLDSTGTKNFAPINPGLRLQDCW
ncbi:type IV pilin protein [Methylocucumis oryzae]|uniref:Pilus assembly protein PilE n=1 Tax=Methylocucumis oryzae TaxID=1632867 RepID=A0A0F3IHU3_9GAMM|nr:type IV pilin protein [Methylocucumis oryzae]KJV05039.1 hypothetical protein VZ94_21030 [Methylocucumis oryzae]